MNDRDSLLDARVLLALTGGLRVARDRVEQARVSESRRRRWQHTLAAIAEGATGDLDRATQQLDRFVGRLDREQV